MATKSAPPQPPEVLAAANKAKPAQAKAFGGPEGATPRLAAGQPPQEEAASEYYSYSESQSSEALPLEKQLQDGPQQLPREDEQPPPLSPAPKARVRPFLFSRGKGRRPQDRLGALREAYTKTAKEHGARRDCAKPSLVQYVQSPDPRERSRRRHSGSPGKSARRRRSHSPGRRVQPGRETSGRSRSQRARHRSRRDSRSPSRRRRSCSRCGRRPPMDRPGRRSWPSEDKESLQESGRWAGRNHAQEAHRAAQEARRAAGMISIPGRAASTVGAGAIPRAEARGGEAKDPKASTPSAPGGAASPGQDGGAAPEHCPPEGESCETAWGSGDINRMVVEGGNAAQCHALTRPAECHPIELRTRWARHVGTDGISAGFPCQAFSRVGLRQGYRDARGQVIFHLIQMCWVLRPRFMVLECVWPLFENPQPCGT